jgi:phosphoenolpyruvate-protein phosphotransferase (PTS system enzyme I)
VSIQVFGLPVSRGVAIGRAVLVASSRVDVAHYFVEPEAIDAEIRRLVAARDQVARELEGLQGDLPVDAPSELSALLDVHLMLLHDEHLIGAAQHWITERRYNAAWALAAQLEVLGRQFDDMDDAYLRERKADVEQVVERVLAAMAEEGEVSSERAATARAGRPRGDEADDLILVANDIAPADMLAFRRSVFSGFVTDVGGKASHTAIVARSMDIPAVVAARDASQIIRQDDWVIVDGDHGFVLVDPSPIVLEEYRFRRRQSELERERLARLRNTPAITLDGEPVAMLANIEMPGDTAAALEAGAVGVGLYRTEFLFMNRGGQLPSEDEQYEAYRSAVVAMQGLPVTIRTIDIGADKPLDRMSASELRHEHTLNPALGLRAIRWSLAEPLMFRQQLRAILRAAVHGPVRLLLPMVGRLGELHAVLENLAKARSQLLDAGRAFGHVQLGAMIEVPAAALTLGRLLPEIDFVSIGTNDLIQYTLAIDRADDSVAHLYDPWHPAVLGLLQATIATCAANGKDVSVCGEVAGDPTYTSLLLAMGLRSFSMHPARLPMVKQAILRSDVRRLREGLQAVLDAPDPGTEAKVRWGA